MKFPLRTTLLVRTIGPACVVLLALLLAPHAAQAGDIFAKICATGVIRRDGGRDDRPPQEPRPLAKSAGCKKITKSD
jgi:hypothetical protein